MPRALHGRGALDALLTDGWWNLPAMARGVGPLRRLAGRFHPELRDANVRSFGISTALAAVRGRMVRASWYEQQQLMNAHFQAQCVRRLRRWPASGARTVFCFSYAARDILQTARARGWDTVLGQIDPGPMESEIVRCEYEMLGLPPGDIHRPPPGYWEDWQAECELADRILVNSKWSAECLAQRGVAPEKIQLVPCAYEAPTDAAFFTRDVPQTFSRARPLRVLFLGQTTIRKGIHLLMEAAETLRTEPVQFTVVGGGLDHPAMRVPTNVTWTGAVPRGQAAGFYQRADVFVLPTLSDGFALVQLEALAWKLPVIATARCGAVVTPGVNGVVLEEISAACLAETLRGLLRAPGELQRLSAAAKVPEHFSLKTLADKLLGPKA